MGNIGNKIRKRFNQFMCIHEYYTVERIFYKDYDGDAEEIIKTCCRCGKRMISRDVHRYEIPSNKEHA